MGQAHPREKNSIEFIPAARARPSYIQGLAPISEMLLAASSGKVPDPLTQEPTAL